jgi:DNA polymerase (family 10)
MPSNQDVAALFYEMADLLEIRGGEAHRVYSFRRTARLLEKLPEPAARLLAWGTLQRKRGIGEGTVRRLKQILRTGTCDDLVRLRSAMPGVRELVAIQGVGPATARELYRRFRVTSVEHLEALARSGALLRLPRFTAERNARLLHEIAIAKRRVARVPLAEGVAIAETIAEKLRSFPDVAQVAIAGSCRRRKATVGDLDILVSAESPEGIVERFTGLDEVSEVLLRRTDGVNVRLASLRQLDLRVVPFDSWGAALQSFTGSKLHNIALRARFNRRGLKLTERGIFDRASGRLLRTGRTEAEIYGALGLALIPPELREDRGELEAAEEGLLASFIEDSGLRGDLHVQIEESAPPSDGESAGDLKGLARRPLDEELCRRLESYLRSGGDAALEKELRRRSSNPLQEAFNLLLLPRK